MSDRVSRLRRSEPVLVIVFPAPTDLASLCRASGARVLMSGQYCEREIPRRLKQTGSRRFRHG